MSAPSKAARELAIRVLIAHQCSYSPSEIDNVAEVCQSALADLLEKAQDLVNHPEYADKMHRLFLALELWKAGE